MYVVKFFFVVDNQNAKEDGGTSGWWDKLKDSTQRYRCIVHIIGMLEAQLDCIVVHCV
jgi:hypothetical protein